MDSSVPQARSYVSLGWSDASASRNPGTRVPPKSNSPKGAVLAFSVGPPLSGFSFERSSHPGVARRSLRSRRSTPGWFAVVPAGLR